MFFVLSFVCFDLVYKESEVIMIMSRFRILKSGDTPCLPLICVRNPS